MVTSSEPDKAGGPKPARKPRGSVTRQALLDAATQEFLASGYTHASLTNIIAAAGGSRRNIYVHFGDKRGLFMEVVRAFGLRLAAQLDTDLRSDLPLAECLREFGEIFLRDIVSHDSLAFYRIIVHEAVNIPNLGDIAFREAEQLATARLEAILTRKIPDLPAGFTDYAQLTATFVSLVRGELHLQSTLYPGLEVSASQQSAQVQLAVTLFLRIIGPL